MSRWKVDRYDYPAQFPELDRSLLPQIRELLMAGDYTLGQAVTEFEERFATYVGSRYAVGVNSGTDALILALEALDIGRDGEVITVTNSFHATAMAIVRVGAAPVLVDCDPATYLIDLNQVERRITAKTKAIIVVHLFGRSVDMASARRLAEARGLYLLEDCAQAIGAASRGKSVGSWSHAGCWSFAPSKNLAAAGDGGAITTGVDAVAARLRLLRHFGQAAQNDHRLIGYNSRLDSIQALILAHKLAHVTLWNARRTAIANRYRQLLAELPISFQDPGHENEHVYHLFQIETSARDALLSHLQSQGIDAVVRYPVPIHLQPAFRELGFRAGAMPVAERLAERTLCLPLHPSMSDGQVEFVCAALFSFFKSRLARRHSVVNQ